MEFFKLVIANKLLPAKLDELVPMSFVGTAAVDFYRKKLKLMKELGVAEEQRKVTLRDGQQHGAMLLDIVARIGQIAAAEPKAKAKPVFDRVTGRFRIEKGQTERHEAVRQAPEA